MTTYNRNASHSYAFLPDVDIPRNLFNRSHEYKTTFDAGYLIPILVDEVIPGDTFTLNSANIFSRINTLICPPMDSLYLECFAFFVPNRLVWNNFKRFMGEQEPGEEIDYTVPQLTIPDGGFAYDSLPCYMGLPADKKIGSVSSLPLRAYNLIYNEWFRDENLQNSLLVPRGDGPDDPSLYRVVRRGKRKDYFTSALPWPQKGGSVTLPLGRTAPIVSTGVMSFGLNASPVAPCNMAVIGTVDPYPGRRVKPVVLTNLTYGSDAELVYNSGLAADLSSATSATVNQLRQAIQVQALQEVFARGGTRYTEIVRASFGVISPDARLQRPELLAVSSSMLNVNVVPQTSSTSEISPQGNLSAFGTFNQDTLSFSKSFTEHGYVIILANVRADLTYQQGVERHWSRKTKLDYYWPLLANLGEQVVKNKEIYADGSANDEGVFGYQERYAEYRDFPSQVTGKLRSGISGSLENWTLSQHFSALPKLNAAFIEDNPPVDRIVAVQNEPEFLMDVHFDYMCARPIPMFGIPSSLGVHL